MHAFFAVEHRTSFILLPGWRHWRLFLCWDKAICSPEVSRIYLQIGKEEGLHRGKDRQGLQYPMRSYLLCPQGMAFSWWQPLVELGPWIMPLLCISCWGEQWRRRDAACALCLCGEKEHSVGHCVTQDAGLDPWSDPSGLWLYSLGMSDSSGGWLSLAMWEWRTLLSPLHTLGLLGWSLLIENDLLTKGCGASPSWFCRSACASLTTTRVKVTSGQGISKDSLTLQVAAQSLLSSRESLLWVPSLWKAWLVGTGEGAFSLAAPQL